MSSEYINRLIILALALTVMGDFIALLAELLSQRSGRKAEKEQQEKERNLRNELDEIRKELYQLKSLIGK